MSDVIRRRALLGTRNGEAHECIVEYEGFPLTTTGMSGYFGPACATAVNWPSGVTTIGSYMFCRANFTGSNFSFPETLIKIGQYAFYRMMGVTNLVFPSTVKSIGQYAFYNSTDLTSITLSSSSDCRLLDYSFYNCTKLASINISENTPLRIGNYALDSTKWLTNKSNGDVYLGKNYVQYKGTMPSNTSLTLESGTLSIASRAFYNKSQLTSITIPNTVKYIEYYAFYGCTGLTSITIPESLSAELECRITENIADEDNRIHVQSGGTKSISPFYNNTGITTINWNAINFRPTGSSTASYNFLNSSYLKNVTTVNIGSKVETIPSYFLNGFTKVTSLTLPNSVTCIGQYAFYGLSAVTSITIPESVTSFGYTTYDYIESGSTTTSWNILQNSGITTLNYNAIAAHRDGYINTGNNLWGKDLTTINIGNQVQVIPGGFLGSSQTSITSITIPSSVTTLDKYSFYGSKLTSIDLPASVTSIGNYAFYSCASLTSITVRATTPPDLGSGGSWFPTLSQAYTIYVPSGSVDTYKSDIAWSIYNSKIQAIPS